MEAVISPFQNAFVKNWVITDNVILSNETMDTIRKKKKRKGALAALKLDMEKAYDRASWVFLKKS